MSIMKKLLVVAAISLFLGACSKTSEPPPPPTVTVKETDEVAVIKAAADKGDPEAQWLYSVELRTGKRIPIHKKEAFIYREKASNTGHARAQLGLSSMLKTGDGCMPDPERAKSLEETGMKALEAAARSGDVPSMVRLGEELVGKSQASPDEIKRGLDLLKAAAEKGNAYAKQQLARSNLQNRMKNSDFDGAIADLTVAFEAGDVNAADFISAIFEAEKKDADSAQKWLEKGWEKGCVLCGRRLAQRYSAKKDEKAANDWGRKAAEKGDPSVQYVLGLRYLDGLSELEKDEKLGVYWITRAAEQEYAPAKLSLAQLYSEGKLLPKDEKKSFDLTRFAAMAGHKPAMFELGFKLGQGIGADEDNVLAYAWTNLAVPDKLNAEQATKNRDIFEKRLDKEEREEAQRLSAAWKLGKDIVREKPAKAEAAAPNTAAPKANPGNLTKTGSGTAFIVSKSGHAITNHHVIDGCKEVRIEGREGVAKVTTSDVVNDVALIQVPGAVNATAAINADPTKLRQGEEIVVFGFPLNAVLSSGGNLTPGIVSAMTGLGNNTNQIQITAPIQPGSSGSPVLNKKGEVVGVVSMKLSDSKMAKATGQVGQNVNFAVSGLTLKSFLDTHQVDYRKGGFMSFDKSTADLADEAKKWTTVVECWK
jgi:TPR repeat protein